MQLDEKGRCCGRKPMTYRGQNTTSTGPHRFCPRCDRAFHLTENRQIPNWAWKEWRDGLFLSTKAGSVTEAANSGADRD